MGSAQLTTQSHTRSTLPVAACLPAFPPTVLGLQRMVPSGAQFLLLNGAAYPMTDFNLYDFLGALRREVRMLRVPRVEGLWAGAVWGLYRLIEGGPHQALLTLLPACACPPPPHRPAHYCRHCLQVRVYDRLVATGLPPAQVRSAQLLRGASADSEEAPRLNVYSDEYIAWVSGRADGRAGMQLPLAVVRSMGKIVAHVDCAHLCGLPVHTHSHMHVRAGQRPGAGRAVRPLAPVAPELPDADLPG